MIASLSKLIDWSAIQVGAMLEPSPNEQNPRLEEALQFLKGPDFIPAESQPARVELTSDKARMPIRFPTPRPCDIAENNVVYGRLYPCAERWQERPVIVLLHGARDFVNYRFRFALIARRCNRAGLNAATLVTPYHFQRRPRQPGAGTWSGPDYLRLAKSMAQGVAEIRALTGWLLGEGCPAVALWGISLGGWLAGMTVCRDARLAAVVPTVPRVRMDLSAAEQVLWRRIRTALPRLRAANDALDKTPLNLTLGKPAIPKENILLIEGIYDLCTPPEPIEELWQAWGLPDIWRLPIGHISIGLGFTPGLTGRVLRWLAPRLNAPAATKRVSRGLPRNAE